MSDKFDPDAWPYSSGDNEPATGQTTRRTDDDDTFDGLDLSGEDTKGSHSAKDDYDDFSFDDEPTIPAGTGAHTRDDDYASFSGQDDDFANPSYDDDDDFAEPTYSTNDTYDDNYDEYDDDFGNEDESNGRSGVGRKILGAVAVVVVVAGLGFGAKQLLGGGGDESALQDTTATTAAGTETTLSEGEDPAATVPSGEVPAEVVDSMNAALNAWGQFAVTGNLDTVRQYFVNDGPQFDRFNAEYQAIAAKATGGAPFSFTMSADPQWVESSDGNWLAKGIVTVASEGKKPATYPWEITMARNSDSEPWQVLSVRQY